jgi:ATP/maltotriose-dependent transcriptional regulator MalT
MDIEVPEWQSLSSSAIWRKHAGDIDGAIAEMVKAIGLTRTVPDLSEETELSLNYLSAELYITKNAIDQAEEAIRDAINLARSRHSSHLGDHLLVLAEVQSRKGEFRSALASAEEALDVFNKQDHSHGVSRAEEVRVCSKRGDFRIMEYATPTLSY